MVEASRRGPYAKGIARRRQILEEALKAYAESDSAGPSLRSIAARAGVSERGLLHYFPSKDELFVEILNERDGVELAALGGQAMIEQLAGVQARSAKTPGLVRLFLEMAASAPDPSNAAHQFFTTRYVRLRSLLAQLLRRSTETSGRRLGDAEAAYLARILTAASDGLQIQWLLDPSIDMEADLSRLGQMLNLLPAARPPGSQPGT